MRIASRLLLVCALLPGCAGTPEPVEKSGASLAIVPVAYPPVSRIEASRPGRHDGAAVGAAGGAAGGAVWGYGAAGLLCTIGGPLCMIVVIPAAIVGAVAGGTVGSVADAIAADPERTEKARAALADAVAQVRTSENVAARAQQSAGPDSVLLAAGSPDFRSLARRGIPTAMEIDHQLSALENAARAHGSASGTGFLYPLTIERVTQWAQGLSGRGFVLVPASAIVTAKKP